MLKFCVKSVKKESFSALLLEKLTFSAQKSSASVSSSNA